MITSTSTLADDAQFRATFPNLLSGKVLSDSDLDINESIIKYALFKTFGHSSSSIKFSDAIRKSYPGEYIDSSLVDHVISAPVLNRRGKPCVFVQVKAHSVGSDPDVVFGDMSVVFFALNDDKVSLQTAARLIEGHCYINDSEYGELFDEVFNGITPEVKVHDEVSIESDTAVSLEKKDASSVSEVYCGHEVRQQALKDAQEGKINPYELVLTYRLSMQADKDIEGREESKKTLPTSAQSSWISRINHFFTGGQK